MKRLLSIVLSISFIITCCLHLTACNIKSVICVNCGRKNLNDVSFCAYCGESVNYNNEENDRNSSTNQTDDPRKDTTEDIKNPRQKLCEFILENGTINDGRFELIESDENSKTVISSSQQGDISFLYCQKGVNNTVSVRLDLNFESTLQTLTYEYNQQGYRCNATAMLFSGMATATDLKFFQISHTENFPSSVKEETIQDIVDIFPDIAKLMLVKVHLMLVKYTGLTLNEFGFINW